VTGFDRFPFDFSALQGGGSRRFYRTRYTRALWDGRRLKIYAEAKGRVSLVYDKEVTAFTASDPQRVRWVDPDAGKEFSLVKSSGCGCKYRELSINPNKTPDPAVLV